MSGLTHFDERGHAHMVDVSAKDTTDRVAVAEGYIKMSAETLEIIMEGRAKKGDVLSVARLAGIMGAKKTSDLIPLCHPLPIAKVAVELTAMPDLPGIRVEATVIADQPFVHETGDQQPARICEQDPLRQAPGQVRMVPARTQPRPVFGRRNRPAG